MTQPIACVTPGATHEEVKLNERDEVTKRMMWSPGIPVEHLAHVELIGDGCHAPHDRLHMHEIEVRRPNGAVLLKMLSAAVAPASLPDLEDIVGPYVIELRCLADDARRESGTS